MGAAGYAEDPILEALLDAGANIEAKDYDGWTPVLCACANGHEETFQLLVKHGADIFARDSGNSTALHCVCGCFNMKIFKCLVEKHGANTIANNKHDESAHDIASKFAHQTIVALLVKASVKHQG